MANGGNTGGGAGSRSRRRSRDPNPPLQVDENVAAQIGGGGNLVNPADPNAFPQRNPAPAFGGSGDVMAAAPIGEGSSQNQQPKKRARLNPMQKRPPPQPHGPIEHPIPDMGDIPPHLHVPQHRLYQLCRKKLTNTDVKKELNITGNNRPFLKHMAKVAGLALQPGVALGVDVQVLNGPDPPVDAFFILTNQGGDALTLAWRELFSRMGCSLAAEQYIDMWFEMAPGKITIYIQGR